MKKLRVKPGERIRLRGFDPDDTSPAPGDKEETNEKSERLIERLGERQELRRLQRQARSSSSIASNYVVARTIVDTLEKLDMRYPNSDLSREEIE